MRRFLITAALLLVAGCGQPTDTKVASNEAEAAPAAEAPAAMVPALDGYWQLTKVDGRPIDPGSGMVGAFRDGKLRLGSGCLRRSWTFTQKRNIVAFAVDPGGSANCGSPPTAAQEAAFYAIDRATMAIFDKRGREASLSGNGGNVTLERLADG